MARRATPALLRSLESFRLEQLKILLSTSALKLDARAARHRVGMRQPRLVSLALRLFNERRVHRNDAKARALQGAGFAAAAAAAAGDNRRVEVHAQCHHGIPPPRVVALRALSRRASTEPRLNTRWAKDVAALQRAEAAAAAALRAATAAAQGLHLEAHETRVPTAAALRALRPANEAFGDQPRALRSRRCAADPQAPRSSCASFLTLSG